MKIKNGFAKRNIAGSNIVVPVGKASSSFNGMITLNDSGSFFWDCFSNDITIDDAVDMAVKEYDVDAQTVKKDIEHFVQMLRENNLLDE
ncbi:MAG: PqqD family protein [Clostridiales bacterium]|nr:PqqD family protein [Clostridiales bacterium]